jgi:hypothetical protein
VEPEIDQSTFSSAEDEVHDNPEVVGSMSVELRRGRGEEEEEEKEDG